MFELLKKIGTGIVVLSVLGWLVWVSTIQAARVKEETISEDQDTEKTEITQPVAYGYREGALLWRLTGLKAVEVKETQKSTVNRIYEMTFYKEGEPNLYASGDAGYWDKGREKLTLKGNVVCTSADGTTILKTEVMTWYERTEVIECPTPIDLWVEDNHITANALYSDKDMVVLDFIGNVNLYAVGLEGESFITREEVFPIDAVEDREKAKKGMNVQCEYLFYNKEKKYIRCYPRFPKVLLNKHNLDENGQRRKPQREMTYDREQQKIVWVMRAISFDGGFEEELAGITPSNEPVDEEMIHVGQALGWDPPGTHEPVKAEDLLKVEPDEPSEEDRDGLEYGETPAQQMLEKSDPDYVPGRVFAHQDKKKTKVWCDFMEIFLDEDKLKARGDVRYEAVNLKDEDRPAKGKVGKAITKEYTWVDANFMNYFWDDEVVDAWGDVHAWQNEKEHWARNMTYHDKLGVMLSYGDVIVEQLGGEWLEENEILEDIEDEDAREDARQPTKVFSNSSLSFTESDWSFGWGDVLFEQEEQKIRGKRVEYDDSSEIMVMFEEVQFRNDDGEWMLADKLTMDFYLETYFVEGAQSQARVLIPEEYQDDLEEWEKEREEGVTREPDEDEVKPEESEEIEEDETEEPEEDETEETEKTGDGN